MNGDVNIKEVVSKVDLKKFIHFQDELYHNNKQYIPSLKLMEFETLSKDINPAFEFCTAKYWLAYRAGKPVGRIAGIINERYNQAHQIKYARFGWIDFVEDEEVVKRLLETVEKWAQAEGMEYVHGPLGFYSFDASGILIEGFQEMPTAFAHYNYEYYAGLIEKAGYAKDIDWIEYVVRVPERVPEKVTQVSDLIKKRYGLRSVVLRKNTDLNDYLNGIITLLNAEYKSIYAFSEISDKQVEKLKRQFIPMLKPEYLSVILDSHDEVIAFGITMPSLSRLMQKAKGRLWLLILFNILHIYQKTTTIDALLIAVKKEYQSKGVTGLIFNDIIPRLIENGFKYFESTKEMEVNKRVNNLWHTYEHRQHKRTRCYLKKL